MNKILQKIYDDIICYEKDCMEMDKKISEEMNRLIKHYELPKTDLEELKSLLYEISRISQREGFFLGIRYAFRIFSALK